MSTLVAIRCERHGPMVQRDAKRQTPEQRWCGVWWDCERCGTSVLFPSIELREVTR